jgi:DNA-binding MarR family transcriptional regulator
LRIYENLIRVTTDAELLGPLLYRVSAKLRAEMATALRPFDLTLSEFVCLKLLRDTPGLSNADLARLFEVSPQTMNATLKALQSSHLIQRPATAPQGRTLPTQITTAGRKLLDSVEPAARNAEATVLAALPAADRRRFRAMLQAVAG